MSGVPTGMSVSLAERPLSPAQEALWLAWRMDPTDPTYHVTLAWQVRGTLDTQRLKSCWETLVARHVALGGSYGLVGERLVRRPCAHAAMAFTVHQTPAPSLERLAARPFDLEHGPVGRVDVFTQPANALIVATLHHIACDGMSARVISDEVTRLYAGGSLAPVSVTWDDAVARVRARTRPAPSEPFSPRLLEAPWTEVVRVPRELARTVDLGARRHGVTPATLFQAALRAWLWRHTKHTQVAVPMAGRARREWRVVGYFSEAQRVDVWLDGATRFSTLISTTAEATSAARKSSAPARTIRCLFNFLPLIPPLALGQLDVSAVEVPNLARIDGIGLTVHTLSDTYALEWSCAHPEWRGSISGWLSSFSRFLEACSQPEATVSSVELLSGDQALAVRRRLDGGPALAVDVCGEFRQRAQEAPDALAVTGQERLTRAELAQRAATFAARLDDFPPGAIIAMELPRDATTLALMLAALQRGLGYCVVPPGEGGLVGAAAVVRRVGSETVIERLRGGVCADQPVAAVVRTSGSTGAPKPVRLGATSFSSYVEHVRRTLELTPADRVLQFHALTFDGHIEEIFPALVAGATVVLRDALGDARAFFTLLEREGVTIISLPTVYWALLAHQAAEQSLHAPSHLRVCIVGGEAASDAALNAWRTVAPQCRFLNSYGPSEATVAVTMGPDTTLGRPGPGARLWVADDEGQPVPPGVEGELIIDGPCLALGVDAPLHSGDLAVLRPDGALEFRGRRDRQLKVLGQRVDPTIVERALEAAGASRAFVDLKAGFLTAWFQGGPALEDGASALRGLPTFARPVRFARVDDWPLTAHGKTDDEALRRWPVIGVTSGWRAPATPREQAIAEVFAQVLNLEQVAADADFFALGGDSLRALECTVRLESVLGRVPSMTELYAHPTAESLARQAEPVDPEWRSDVHLLDSLPPAVTSQTPPPRHVLLTGATGLVGAHLLAAWLSDESRTATCLIRAPDERSARVRLEMSLRAHGVRAELSRVRVIAGALSDLSKLGKTLEVDAVFHAAGLTDLRLDYAALRQANVLGVAQVLSLGLPAHLVSSESAVNLNAAAPPASGYARAKWVGERLAEQARARGYRVGVYRMGRVWGNSHAGRTPRTDALWTAVARGVLPLEAALTQVTPADVVAQEIVQLALQPAYVTHTLQPRPPQDAEPYRRALADQRA